MIPYSQIENKLEEKVEFESTRHVLENDSDTRTSYASDSSYENIFPEEKSLEASDAERRKGERTFYTEYNGESVAVKISRKTSGSLVGGLARKLLQLETPSNEARMLHRARGNGIEVAEPLCAGYGSSPKSGGETLEFVVKNAGDPKSGEVPYWLTDMGKLSSSYEDSKLESHLNESLQRTLGQLSELRDAGLIHRSMTPISHRVDDGFSVYSEMNFVRHFGEEVNITPTGELKDFEHVKKPRMKRLRRTDRFADSVAETFFSYLWTARSCGFSKKETASSFFQAVEEISGRDENIHRARERTLRELSGEVGSVRKGGKMLSTSLRELALQVTHDRKISSPGKYGMNRDYY
ncbi:MAG: hypothetical protein ABEJ98_02995 [Candidatus Nanohaloarchaea archaeon]